ncbi:membrane-bound ClpP family serine protease [Microbacterium keratanolyticum]|uniref:Uncharacterized protein n=1 Tax=Microbacterium keratanolyticum TaxID=67574 RepID=A0A9W6HVC8_9MICO|nr:hypothetical protein [Microbacterium keratanolyticum]MBM7468034.1 membrane-bound ClpP family serine protease [Microbacterium keratanolyticum]GLK03025.1 hypothetical protein GCM10017596_27400 [Microbacterium keratanolyticum]
MTDVERDALRLDVPAEPRGTENSKGFAIMAALVLAFGGFLLPIVGYLVGIVLVAMSRLWRPWEKLLAILLPFGVTAVIGAVSWILGVAQRPTELEGVVVNPLLPASYDLWFSTLILGILIVPACSMWLLWRLRDRTPER